MGLIPGRLPRFLVLDPVSSVRFELGPRQRVAELDVELENPGRGRSFLLLVGPQGGPALRRLRLGGGARVLFDRRERRPQVLMFANPQKEPLVLQLRVRPVGRTRSGNPSVRPGPVPRVAPAPSPATRGRSRLAAEVVGDPRSGTVPEALGDHLRRPRPKG